MFYEQHINEQFEVLLFKISFYLYWLGCYTSSVTEIGESAFRGCRKLKSIHIPPKIKTIKEYTFFDCQSLPSIKIPYGVTEIEDEAFGWCKNLTSMSIPKTVNKIGKNAFKWCTNLYELKLRHRIVTDVLNDTSGLDPRNISLLVPSLMADNYKKHIFYSLFKNIIEIS